jgi:xanthine dehydrogenase molybdopterin-binding subunit B
MAPTTMPGACRAVFAPCAHQIRSHLKASFRAAIITSADLPDLTNGDRGMRDILENCMARKKALYDGHAVAAVAAIDQATARKALKLIRLTTILPRTDV